MKAKIECTQALSIYETYIMLLPSPWREGTPGRQEPPLCSTSLQDLLGRLSPLHAVRASAIH